jgi:hypothetical protein
MKKIMLILSLFILFSAYLISCSYLHSPDVKVLPEYIKKVYVKPTVVNQFGVETEFIESIEKEIIIDGRLSLVNIEEEADAIFIVGIKKYDLQPIIYNANTNRNDYQYKLSIEADILLVDKDKNVIFRAPDMKMMYIYRDYMRDPFSEIFYDGMSERKTRRAVFNKFSKYVVRRAVK